ncbi:MAG: cytochrome c1 [Methylobacterium sp.]|nr:cytochrome c1 [Methylobacterium sp.]
MNKLILILSLLLPGAVMASEGVHLDKAPINSSNQASLQRGAKVFVNYCLNCHAAASMRFNRLKDIGLTEEQIKQNLIFGGQKVGDLMTSSMNAREAKAWFGATPPDLSVVARSRGVDWLYSYLRGFYRDETRPTGWNNTVFDKVGMPHALWQLQGEQRLVVTETVGADGVKSEQHALVLAKKGSLSPAEYDMLIADLVNYLDFMAEPAKAQRKQLGFFVLIFLFAFFFVALALKKEFWKDVH